MTQYQFNELLEKYLAGNCTAEEQRLVEQWSGSMLQHTDMKLSATEKQVVEKRIWSRIRQTTIPKPIIIQNPWLHFSAAASVLLLLGLGWFLYNRSADVPNTGNQAITLPKGVIQIKNTSDKPRKITLEDGSLVVLKVNSSISYPEHFGDKTRSVLLEGEAFFDVQKNPTKPFVVHTGELVTEVLGTRFTIRFYEHTPSIEVRVESGRVSVYENSTNKSSQPRNGVILTPNQRVIFDKASRKLEPSLVENPVVIHPPANPQRFLFDETPLPTVLNELEKAFGVEILIENQNLNKCVLTADLMDLPLHSQLDLVCRSINATYQQRGTVIFINGEGCQ